MIFLLMAAHDTSTITVTTMMRHLGTHPQWRVQLRGGVHKCLGLAFAGSEVKLVLHQLLRRFDWTVDASYRDQLNYHSLPFPADGQPVDLRRLERTHPR